MSTINITPDQTAALLRGYGSIMNPAPTPAPAAQPLIAKPDAPSTPNLPGINVPTQNPAIAGLQQKRQQMLSSGAGVDQIKNPFLHGLAKVGDVIGGMVAPGLMAAIPGTEAHHNLLLGQNEANINNDLGIDQKEATIGKTQADVPYEEAQTENLLHPKDQFTPVPTSSGIESFSKNTGAATPVTGANNQPLMPFVKPGPRQHVFLQGSDGKPLAATFDPQSGTYYDAHDTPIQNPQPYEKPAAPNELSMWLKEHPGKTVDDYIAMQNSTKAEFPRIVPVNDAKGNIVGYNTFSGTGGGVRTEFVPLSSIHGLPQNLGGTPGVIPPKPTGTVLTQSQRAEMMQPQVAALTGQIDKTASQLGPLAGRWSDVMAGRVGADNPDVAKLQMQLKMFTTALMLAHGLRGEEYERSLSQYLNTAQSPGNLIARIQGADAYLQDYAGATGHGSNPNTPQHVGENGGNGGGMIRAVDPQGKLHEAPAGTPLPKGWKLQ